MLARVDREEKKNSEDFPVDRYCENFRNDSCETRHCVGTRPRKTHAQAIHTFAPVLEHGDFIDTRRPWASQQLTGGGRWNAGDLRQTRLLTCELTMDADALAAKKNGGRAPRNRRSSDGPRFTVWNEGYNVFLFGPSDSRLNISCHSVGVVCEDTAERVVRRSSSAPFGVDRADFDNRT